MSNPLRQRIETISRPLVNKLGLRPDWYLTVVGALIGLVTALGAIAFATALYQVEHWAGQTRSRWPLWTLPLLPMLGALITGALIHFFASEARGHGVPQVLDALIRRGGRIRTRIGVVKVIASIFNAPIAGVFFALEILLRDFSLRTFTPIVIAAVFATALTQVYYGQNDAIFAAELFERAYVFTPGELPGYVVLGLVCAFVAVGFTHLLHAMEDFFERLRVHPIVMPVLGALLIGVLGIAYLVMTQSAGETPRFFGNGYETISALLEPRTYHEGGEIRATVLFLALLLVCKAMATTFTLGSGGSGGVFAPSLFLGATAGGSFGIALERLGLIDDTTSPASYALVGMAAVVAGTTFAPLTAILLLFELTREPRVLAPIMLAAIVSTMVARRLMPDSIYTARLRQKGIRIGSGRDLTLLRRVPVMSAQVTPLPEEPVYASDPLSKLITLHAHHNVPDFVVVNQDGEYMGMVTGADMRTALIDRELVRTDIPTVHPDETLDTVLDKFAKLDVSSLCLVHDRDPTRPMGLITRSNVMSRYQRALEES